MSDFHILKTGNKLDKATVAFHIAIPDENNSATPVVNLRTALSDQINAGAVSQVPWLETDFASEYAQIQSGEIFEHVEVVTFSGNAIDADKVLAMDNKHAELEISIVEKVRNQLKFWGHNRDVV